MSRVVDVWVQYHAGAKHHIVSLVEDGEEVRMLASYRVRTERADERELARAARRDGVVCSGDDGAMADRARRRAHAEARRLRLEVAS